jgi:poly(3-hydroxybutyrate) depolymerase
MKRTIYLFSLLLLLAMQAEAYKKESIDIQVNNQTRNMVVFTPNTFPAKSPLFIVTHGMNQNPEYQYGSDKMYEMIDTAKFVITYLRSNGSTWDTGGTSDQKFVIQAIEEMATRFDIDKERVYWSGFSMGSMLIHHCIANMQDKIAAFAPTSGIQFSESPWNNCKKPVNLLEVISYKDDVFGYEKYGIHSYIENYAKHDKHTTYSKTTGYKPFSSCWYNGDLEKWTGGANGGEVWLYSYNEGGHWPMSENRQLIWNFCKRFSLNMPSVKITSPSNTTTHLYIAPKEEVSFPDIELSATAKSSKSTIRKVVFYDGNTFLDSLKEAPYTTTIKNPTSGKHNVRAVAFDENGKTAESSCLINYAQPTSAYSLIQNFKAEGCVPQDWYVGNGTAKRIGGGLPFTAGNRILRFTNATKGFEYGLLIQNTVGKEKSAWAKFGDKTARSTMTLYGGHYLFRYKICNWNQPSFSPVTIVIEDTNGNEIASQVYTPTSNIGNNTGNKFTATLQTFEFDIPETGNYVLAIYANSTKNSDFVLGQAYIQGKTFLPTSITNVSKDNKKKASGAYDLSGRRVNEEQLKSGLYIINGRKTLVR